MRGRVRNLIVLASTFAMVLVLSVGIAGAITNGSEDTSNQYPYVGMLAFYDGSEAYMHRCTGTLISSTVVVTASHCTDGTSTARAYFEIEVTDDFRNAPTEGSTGTPNTHPDYNSRTLTNDVAVVILDSEAGVSGPYPSLPSEGLLSQMKRNHDIQDDSFVAIGYGGVPGFPPSVIEFDLKRRSAVSHYGALNRNNLQLLQNPNVNDAGGTCFGDSGGPHLSDTNVLVSVTSWGDAICRTNDMTQRLDLASTLDFIESFLS